MVNRRRTNSNLLPRVVVIAGVLLVGGVLTYAIGAQAGWFTAAQTQPQKPSREGMVPVVRTLKDLRAFDTISVRDIYDLKLQDDSFAWMPKNYVQQHPGLFTNLDKIVGRVMARDLGSDNRITERDLLPTGSRSGLSGGVPEGKQGFFIDASQVAGLRLLKNGDRFDLLASLPKETQQVGSEYGLLMGGIKVRDGKPIPLNGVRVLAQNAQMIAVTNRNDMTTRGGMNLGATDGRGRSNNTAEQVAIAIDPTEAVPLTQALGDKLAIHMVARSGQETQHSRDADLLNGRIAMPASAIAIEAFQPITASDLSEPTTGILRQYYFQPDDIQDNWIARPEDLIGRVVGGPIEPGYIFSESDLLPSDSLVNPVDAYQTITASDLVDGNRSNWVGRVTAVALQQGSQIVEDNLLPSGSLISNIPAYQAIAASDLVDGHRSNWVGRIAAVDLEQGSQIAESQLLPAGSPPGIAAAIPDDRMALTLDTKDLRGASQLSRGNHCDLLSSTSVDLTSALGAIEVSPQLLSSIGSKSVNKLLATGAMVIHVESQQVVLAVVPDEISRITKALAAKEAVFCIARASEPMRPKDQHAGATVEPQLASQKQFANELASDPDPLSQIQVMETMIGGQRKLQAFRGDK
ncbi:MAG: hypothetical protein CBB71_22005 [Rhodopirellula sp. TMED11]|nr:MAG: hypothetical protein CBB71_22005 [Rhodopirellula sp. TMED11]